jgi:hypothetical protein
MSEKDVVVEEYQHDCRIVRERIEGEEDRFHYEGPLGRVKSFYSLDKARLYADVHTVTGGFREEKTGERGVPPAVARAREDVVMAYLVSNPTMGMKWVSRAYDLPEEQVRSYVELVQNQATEMRGGENDDNQG